MIEPVLSVTMSLPPCRSRLPNICAPVSLVMSMPTSLKLPIASPPVVGLVPPRASIVPKLSTLLRGLAPVVSMFSKKIAELATALTVPRLMIALPAPIGLMASSVVCGPEAMTDAFVLMVSVELLLNSIVLSPLPYSPRSRS